MHTAIIKKRPSRRPATFVWPNFENLFNEVMRTDVRDLFAHRDAAYTYPAVNVQESADRFALEMALPGLTKKDVEIQVDKDVLTVKADHKTENDGTTYQLREFRYGVFNRRFHLPESIDTNAIKAEFKNGILTVVLGKKDEAKDVPARTIDIK